MRNIFIYFTISIAGMMFVSFAQAKDKGPSSNNKNTIIIKSGSFNISEASQTIAGSSATFEENSSSVIAIEYSRKFGNNLTYGGELVKYSNEYATFISGDVDTTIIIANIKKYFDLSTHFQPFIGAGAGAVLTTVSGPFDGSAGGFATSLVLGAEIPFENIGIHIEYKYLSATADNETTSGNTAKFDVSGSGIFAGVSIHF